MSAATERTENGGGRLVVMSGPSGSGKTTIKKRLAAHPAIRAAVTVTTRPPRKGEQPEVDYHFVSRQEFLTMQRQGRFAETNDVFSNGHLYGSLRDELVAALSEPGCVYLMEVDITGAHHLKQAGYEGLYLFIAPPSMEVLEQRLRKRGTDDEAAIRRRLDRAREEMELAEREGLTLVPNESVETAVSRILRLIGLDEQAPQPS